MYKRQVLQDTNLFTGTVMDNIRYGRLDACDEECIAAAKLAGAHAFITRLPQGSDTPLSGNGASLSQGQRQLLAIARAAVADPPVMPTGNFGNILAAYYAKRMGVPIGKLICASNSNNVPVSYTHLCQNR